MMRAALLCLLFGACATQEAATPPPACPPLPTLVEHATAAQVAAYAQQVVDLYGQCATIQESKGAAQSP
ncbi:hypothetical protein [Paraburkholderia sp. MM6662-R1]|uniref:hypothetical protein n=1 Tax=Paraburkholderia sp. MM6662-R1 TaxID=2991066 RepID=UPI003D1BB96D